MRFRSGWLLAILGLVVLCSGCVSSRSYDEYRAEMDERSFVKCFTDTWCDWFADLSDVASAELSAGPGIGLNVQPTELLNAGVMFEDVMKVGWRNRGAGFYTEARKEGGLSWFYYRDVQYEPIIGVGRLDQRPARMQGFTIRDNTDRHWLDVGAEAHLVFFGAGAFVSPKEMLDFLGNTLTLPYNLFLRVPLSKVGFNPPELDLSNDDTGARARERHGLKLIKTEEGFEPVETLDELLDAGY